MSEEPDPFEGWGDDYDVPHAHEVERELRERIAESERLRKRGEAIVRRLKKLSDAAESEGDE